MGTKMTIRAAGSAESRNSSEDVKKVPTIKLKIVIYNLILKILN
jgi:hypothetical protein